MTWTSKPEWRGKPIERFSKQEARRLKANTEIAFRTQSKKQEAN